MNWLQWVMYFSIGGFAYTVGWYKGLEVGRVEGYRRRKAMANHVSQQGK